MSPYYLLETARVKLADGRRQRVPAAPAQLLLFLFLFLFLLLLLLLLLLASSLARSAGED
ncbi:hypothetical protein DT603_08085 [Pseudoxanthomonas gei]|uniref:Uncharacterized protein n=1 Tax=Pseudoxanthomonas gei TaxID=1383030 RepID=A0ABX0ABE0_9GAMM|nr:hypothetical protein [Pseudoxanthomonas gei]